MSATSRWGPLLAGLLALLWGSNFLWIKVALDGLSPVQLTFARLASGALVLGVFVWIRRERVPSTRTFLGHLAIAALLANAAPYLLFAIGEQTVSSATAGVLNSTAPLWTVLIVVVSGQEPLPLRRAAGLAVGFAGAVLILQPWRSAAGGSLGGQLACLTAAVSYGLSYVYIARYLTPRRLSPLVVAFGQLACATLLLVPAIAVAGRQPAEVSAEVLGAVTALGLIGTGAAYVINYTIVAREGATTASTVTYLLPIVSVSLGVLVLDETFGASALFGAALVLAGVALVRRGMDGHKRSPGPIRRWASRAR